MKKLLRWLWLRPQIKVFSMNDCDWVAARDLSSAMNFYESYCSCEPDWAEECEPHQLSAKAMRKLQYTRSDENDRAFGEWSFRKQLNHAILSGEPFPNLFASTEF